MDITRLPSLAVGTMWFGTRVADDDAHAVLDRARDLGACFLDTANNYAFWEPGAIGDESERCLGGWFARRGVAAREEMLLATKVGARPARPGGGLDDALGLAAAAVTAQLEDSLRRLRVDHVDLVYAHVDDPAVDPAETVAAFGDLIDRGLARAFAVSNLTADRIRTIRAAGKPAPTAVQNRFSYLVPRPDGDLAPHVLLDDDVRTEAAESDMLAVGYSPLLEGAYTRDDRPLPAAYGPRTDHAEALGVLDTAAATVGLDAGQTVLAWMTQRPAPVLPVVGCSTIPHLEAAWQAVRTRLPTATIDALEAARRP